MSSCKVISQKTYVTQPSSFVDLDYPSHACKPRKIIYGLKQAPLGWYHEFHTILVASGFDNSHAATSLFVLNTSGHIISLLFMLMILLLHMTMMMWYDALWLYLPNYSHLRVLGLLPTFLVWNLFRTNMSLSSLNDDTLWTFLFAPK